MIELLLHAERSLGIGALDEAERLYWQAIDADGQNAIAIVGLAKVARQRGDDRTAIAFARRALKVDAENAVARRLVAELDAAHPEDVRTPVATAEHTAPVSTAEPAPPVATAEPEARPAPASAPDQAPPADADNGTRPAERADGEWPAADLKQVRRPLDR